MFLVAHIKLAKDFTGSAIKVSHHGDSLKAITLESVDNLILRKRDSSEEHSILHDVHVSSQLTASVVAGYVKVERKGPATSFTGRRNTGKAEVLHYDVTVEGNRFGIYGANNSRCGIDGTWVWEDNLGVLHLVGLNLHCEVKASRKGRSHILIAKFVLKCSNTILSESYDTIGCLTGLIAMLCKWYAHVNLDVQMIDGVILSFFSEWHNLEVARG